jgi:hypothetical protein
MQKILFLLVATLAFWASCTPDTTPTEIEGWKPVYLPTTDINDIRAMDSISLGETGKIYTKGKLVYVGKPGWGVHVLDNSTHSLRNVAFIQIPGCNDIAIKGDVLYSDNMKDLVAIRLDPSDPKQITLLNRSQGMFQSPDMRNYPAADNAYFECVDHSKGIVGGWSRALLNNPKCRTNASNR